MHKEKLIRLRKVLSDIEELSKDINNFEVLENLRKKEYQLEGGESAVYVMNDYRHNLEQTGFKQADGYIAAKRKKSLKKQNRNLLVTFNTLNKMLETNCGVLKLY
jgi:hypothetical protein